MSFRFRAYPHVAQVDGLFSHASHARFVWNLACEQQSHFRVEGRVSPPPNSAVRFRQLAEARSDNGWLAAGSSSIQQLALRDYDRAMAAFSRERIANRRGVKHHEILGSAFAM